MKQIDFHFNVVNRTLYACHLIKKVHGMGLKVAVWGMNKMLMKRAYDDLWRFEDLTFIADAWAGSSFEEDAPVVFAQDIAQLKSSDVLVLLDDAVPTNWQQEFARFDRVVDIVSTDPRELQCSRDRFRIYKAAGIELKAYDRSKA